MLGVDRQSLPCCLAASAVAVESEFSTDDDKPLDNNSHDQE